MKEVVVKCPAKINLTLEIVNRREDEFHNINSIMQLISLYDYLQIKVEDYEFNEIQLSGTSEEIPYDERNLVYKAARLFVETLRLNNKLIKIHIEKNIPIAAGLAGGSTDAAGTLYGLNEIFGVPLSREQLHELCAKLGSDLNVCLEGGCILATSRGEKIQKLKFIKSPVTLIKPNNLGISAKEAYIKYASKQFKPEYNNTEKMISAINAGEDIKPFLYNDLEYAVYDDYVELQEIKNAVPNSMMSGSGSTYFVLADRISDIDAKFTIYPHLEFVDHGVGLVE